MAPTEWWPAPALGAPVLESACGRRSRNSVVSLVVAAVLAVSLAWTATGHQLLPTPDSRTTAPPVTRIGPPPGLEEAAVPLGDPVQPSKPSTAFRFGATQPGSPDIPVAFSPCRPIHYVIRPEHSPRDGEAVINRAVSAVSKATGLFFVYDGATAEKPVRVRQPYQPSRYGDHWAPVLIAWADADEVPDLRGDTLGVTYPYGVSRFGGSQVYVTGSIVFDADDLTDLRAQGGGKFVPAVVKHELAHLVGLGHVKDPTQIMNPRATRGVYGFQAGDLAGLAALGRGACARDV